MASKRTILITGCSDGGLGSELCLAFHKAGYRVFATARNLSKLKDTEAVGIESVELDATSPESIAACVAEVKGLTGGSLDALLNNAGAGYSMPIIDMDLDQVRKLYEVNVFPIISLAKAFMPLLLESKHGARIINNTSIASFLWIPFQSAYSSSKAAASALTETLRMELAPFNIKVIELKTGAVTSNFFKNVSTTTLPADSRYGLAREEIEKVLEGEQLQKGALDAKTWAEQIVRDLDPPSPPIMIWRGTSVAIAKISSWLPYGWLDGVKAKETKLDVFAQRLKAQP